MKFRKYDEYSNGVTRLYFIRLLIQIMIYDSKADGVVTVKSTLYVTSTTVPVFENVIQSKQFSYGGPVPTDNNTRFFSALGEMKLFIITTQIVTNKRSVERAIHL